METLRALHPLAAVIIIVAVTVVIAIAAIGWVTGVFSAAIYSSNQQLYIYDAVAYRDSCILNATLRVEGRPVKVLHVYVEFYGEVKNYTIYGAGPDNILQPGREYRLVAYMPGCDLPYTATAKVKVVADNGVIYMGVYRVVLGSS
ncbi:hypothetical protein [Hyperthermus butylicus]|uniref:Uncharacterized protein n=1 Tax=Hyperthermus butylicus (strain DSM 5456 / JCM 9403 / PLM1-5) TaxID=415426 RepID=A2BMP7_HYPBU|nr:hypothetical protein [Hyperthermus butylicus]ABM81258.1 hypothetical protein Hbut_1434 [Hyperthermus butylicus DSM 5456]